MSSYIFGRVHSKQGCLFGMRTSDSHSIIKHYTCNYMILLKPNLSCAWSHMSDYCPLFNCVLFDNYNLVYICRYCCMHLTILLEYRTFFFASWGHVRIAEEFHAEHPWPVSIGRLLSTVWLRICQTTSLLSQSATCLLLHHQSVKSPGRRAFRAMSFWVQHPQLKDSKKHCRCSRQSNKSNKCVTRTRITLHHVASGT